MQASASRTQEGFMTPFVAYCRVSGMSQVEGDGFLRQRGAILGWMTNQNMAGKPYRLEHIYDEEGVSGKTDAEERPAFQRMIGELLGNGCRTIVIESLDRLARGYAIQEQLITYIASKGLTLIAANTGEDITAAMMGDPMKRAMVQMQGIFAELDKNMLVAKLRKARERKKAKDGQCEGRKAFGHYPGEATVLNTILAMHRSNPPASNSVI